MHDPLASLPPAPAGDDFELIRALVARSGTKLVVLDDDPTGTQTVHDVPVLAEWSVSALSAVLAEPGACFYILTNSRALPRREAVALNKEIMANLAIASRLSGRAFAIVSRSDSTLRGHFPDEIDAITSALEHPVDGVLLVPAFIEGCRLTVHGVHYVGDGGRMVPAGETEFARDATFGYRSSSLAQWVEEKTRGRMPASQVACVSIDTLRAPGGAARVCDQLLAVPGGSLIAVDAAAYLDLEVFVHGLLRAEAAGRRFVARTAASFVRVRAGIPSHPILGCSEISPACAAGGLIVVGSYVARTTGQLEFALKAPGIDAQEVRLDALIDSAARQSEIARIADRADRAISGGHHALIYTSRNLISAVGRAGELDVARCVSESLVAIVRRINPRPRFFIAKGGITASDLATMGLGMKRAIVLGQAAPGVPVWRMGAETRFPGMAYVVFPGNVGSPKLLRDMIVQFGA